VHQQPTPTINLLRKSKVDGDGEGLGKVEGEVETELSDQTQGRKNRRSSAANFAKT
jgi:hypothetical protein